MAQIQLTGGIQRAFRHMGAFVRKGATYENNDESKGHDVYLTTSLFLSAVKKGVQFLIYAELSYNLCDKAYNLCSHRGNTHIVVDIFSIN